MAKDSKNYEARCFKQKAYTTDSIFITRVVAIAGFGGVLLSLLVEQTFTGLSCFFLLVSLLMFALHLFLKIRNQRYDFNYTIILKEDCFTIEGKPHASWYAWPLDCTYEFNQMKREVTIYDSIGNHRTYLYNDAFKEFLEEIQKK